MPKPVTWTFIKDATNQLLNIRIATDEAGFDDNANRAAIARYFGFPEKAISAELDGWVYLKTNTGSQYAVASVRRVTMAIEYDQSAA